MTSKIDAIDRKLLFRLYDNSRSPVSKIAKDIGTTREIVEYRLNKLEKEGIIKGYIAKINHSLFCEGVANVLFKLTRPREERFQEILMFLTSHPSINWIAELSGNADIATTILYKNSEDLSHILSEITTFLGKNLREHELSLYITEYKFYRGGILAHTPITNIPASIISFGEHEQIGVDEKDFLLLSELSKNCRIKNIDLAKKVKISEDMVRIRIRNLEKRKIIFGYTFVMDINRYGLESYYLNLHIENMTKETIAKIQYYVWNNPYIGYCARTAGKYNIIISLYAKGRKHFHELLLDIRKNLSSDLVHYEINLLMEEHKEVFLPENFCR